MDLEKLTDRARGFLQAAQTIAVREHHQQIRPAHYLKALLDDEQGMAASQFRIAETSQGTDWATVIADVHRALSGELALSARLAERARTYRRRRRPAAASVLAPSVVFVDAASSNATVIEVRAPDSIGLLHRVATALAEMGLDIRHATVQTIGPSVVDSFYVRTSDGTKVTDSFHRAEIERAVLHAVGSPS